MDLVADLAAVRVSIEFSKKMGARRRLYLCRKRMPGESGGAVAVAWG